MKKLIDLTQTTAPLLILAEDEATWYVQVSTMAVWALCGQAFVVRMSPGRASTAFYRTLDFVTGQERVTQAAKMNAETIAVHRQTIRNTYPHRTMLLLWDKAPWHRGPAIIDCCNVPLCSKNCCDWK